MVTAMVEQYYHLQCLHGPSITRALQALLHIHWCLLGATTQRDGRVGREHPPNYQFHFRCTSHCSHAFRMLYQMGFQIAPDAQLAQESNRRLRFLEHMGIRMRLTSIACCRLAGMSSPLSPLWRWWVSRNTQKLQLIRAL